MFTRCYAFMYDRISRGSERAGLRDERPALRGQPVSCSSSNTCATRIRGSRRNRTTRRSSTPGWGAIRTEPPCTRSPVRSCLSWPFAVVRSRRHP